MKARIIQAGDVDASTFQHHVENLAITMTNKIEREGITRLPKPNYLVTDLGVILRQAVHTYDLLYFLNSDEIQSHSGYRQSYSFAALPLIRTMIDCLYNTTALLEEPNRKGPAFRKSGYRQLLESINQQQMRHGGEPKWDAHLANQRDHLLMDMRSVGFTESEVKLQPLWPTLSAYLRVKKGSTQSHNQLFLRTLTFGYWADYSSISHATFQGLKMTAPFFLKDRTTQENRELLGKKGDLALAIHLARAAAILLCNVTEMQAFFKFDGARINDRVRECWQALNVFTEVEELFEQRYKNLLKN